MDYTKKNISDILAKANKQAKAIVDIAWEVNENAALYSENVECCDLSYEECIRLHGEKDKNDYGFAFLLGIDE